MSYAPTFNHDPQLLAAVSTPVATIADVIRVMQSIDILCPLGDGLKWFNLLYLQVTQAVDTRTSTGGFADPAWIAALDVQFAKLYFGALKSHLSGTAAPGSWRALFNARNQTAVARIQFALAGVNAHINHDLAIAIGNTCKATSSAPSHTGAHYADYTNLNSTLQSLTDSAKATMNLRLLGDVLPPVSHLENTFAGFSVSAAREAAWDNAEILWALRNFPLLRDRMLYSIDGLTTVAGKALLVPVPAVQMVAAT